MRLLSLALVAVLAFCSSANAATIYFCKAYSGGTFWSNTICSAQKALIDRTATVPDGMPFNQQVDLAQQQLEAAKKLYAQPSQQSNLGGGSCTQLAAERHDLDQITEKMIWVPIETQNANYYRMNQIKADMARLGCR
jgi:hypothetical protein